MASATLIAMALACCVAMGDVPSIQASEPEQITPYFSGSTDGPRLDPSHPPIDQLPPIPMPEPTDQTRAELSAPILHDAVTGQTITLPFDNRSSSALGQVGGYEGAEGPYDAEALLRTFGDMSEVTNTASFPWRMNCKLVMRFGSNYYVGSGSMIDAETILTAGHCVYDYGGYGWADEIWVYPGQDCSEDPYGVARGTFFATWTGWTDDGSYDHDIGVIRVTRAVGMLTGWFGRAYGGDCALHTSKTYNNASYPAENCPLAGLHTGCDMFYWSGTFDSCPTVNQLQINTSGGCYNAGWGGMSGSGFYYIFDGSRYIHAVASNSNRSTILRCTRLTEAKSGYIGDTFIPDSRGSTFDLQPLNVNVEPAVMCPGSTTTLLNHLATNPTNGTDSATWVFRVYLSTNDNISATDTLLSTQNYPRSFGAMSSVRVNMVQVTIPANTPPGDYWIGVVYDSSTDGDDSNNDTDDWDAAPITVVPCCSCSIAPTSGSTSASGGSGAINVTTQSGCSWTASESCDWVSLSPTSGTGSGTVTWTATANTGVQRTCTINVCGNTFTLTQEGISCSIAPTSGSVSASGGSGAINVTATGSWTASESCLWVTISPTSGTGSGTVTWTATVNTGAQRTCPITICGNTFTLTQPGACIGSRSFDSECIHPGDPTVRVTVTIVADQNYTGLALDENPPAGWTVTPVSSTPLATYNAAQHQWLWLSAGTGNTLEVVYDLTAPGGAPYNTYSVLGTVQSSAPALNCVVEGDTDIAWQADPCIPCCIEWLVAHWDEVCGCVDPQDPCEIDLMEILAAIAWWADSGSAPAAITDVVCTGWPIDLTRILSMIPMWAVGTCIDDCDSFTSASAPMVAAANAARAIDPDCEAAGETVQVTVTINATGSVTGLALDEDPPAGWTVTPVSSTPTATYNASEHQWLWLSAGTGDTLTVVYDVTIPGGATDGPYTIDGSVQSASPSFNETVAGEDTVTVGCGGGGLGCWDDGLVTVQAAGSGTDQSNSFGVSPTADDCNDVQDIPEPPAPPSPYTRLWFEMDASCSDTQAYSRDVKASMDCEDVKTWTMKVTDDGAASQVVLSWDPQELPPLGVCEDPLTPTVTLLDLSAGVSIDMRAQATYTYTKAGNPETRTFEIVVDCSPCREKCLNLIDAGWHMTTLQGPLCGECATTFGDLCCALCDDLNPCFIFHYDPAIGGYVMVPPCDAVDFQAGMGLWVNVNDPTTVCAPVRPQAGPITIPLGIGWNQVGNPFEFRVLLSSARIRYQGQEVTIPEAHANGWVSQYLFGYDPGIGGYEMVMPPDGELREVSGYWILAYVACELVISDAPAPPAPPQSAKRADLLALRVQGIPTPPAPPTLSAMHENILAGLEVGNYPNPVRSEHTTTFRVSGPKASLVDAVRVDIYDQSGQLVWMEEAEARETQWHTKNALGELLANGVYLYRVWVRIGELWLPTGIQKVAVVR